MQSYEAYPALAGLPPLVRKQRTLEAKIAPVTPLIEQEKAIRKDIDALLIAAKIPAGDGVTCNGYDVAHVERVGARRLNEDVLVEQLVAAGLAPDRVERLIEHCTHVGEPSTWATVKPSKGAKVRR